MSIYKRMHLVVPVTSLAGIGNTLKGLITALSLTDDAKVRCNPMAMMGDFTKVLADEHIYKEGTNGYDEFSTCRFLILKSEENVQRDLPNELSYYNGVDMSNPKFHWLFSMRSMIDFYYDRSLIADVVFDRILRGINKICWTGVVLSEVARVRAVMFPSAPTSGSETKPPGSILGISIRTWKAKHEYNIDREYSPQKYQAAIREAVREAKCDGKEKAIDRVFISFDNPMAAPDYVEALTEFTIISYVKPDHVTELQCAVIKMLLLSETDYFVCNRISTFSELVFWFGGCRQRVFPVC